MGVVIARIIHFRTFCLSQNQFLGFTFLSTGKEFMRIRKFLRLERKNANIVDSFIHENTK